MIRSKNIYFQLGNVKKIERCKILMLNISLYRSHIVCIINFQTLQSTSFISKFSKEHNICDGWIEKKLNLMVPRTSCWLQLTASWQLPSVPCKASLLPPSVWPELVPRNGNALAGPVLARPHQQLIASWPGPEQPTTRRRWEDTNTDSKTNIQERPGELNRKLAVGILDLEYLDRFRDFVLFYLGLPV